MPGHVVSHASALTDGAARDVRDMVRFNWFSPRAWESAESYYASNPSERAGTYLGRAYAAQRHVGTHGATGALGAVSPFLNITLAEELGGARILTVNQKSDGWALAGEDPQGEYHDAGIPRPYAVTTRLVMDSSLWDALEGKEDALPCALLAERSREQVALHPIFEKQQEQPRVYAPGDENRGLPRITGPRHDGLPLRLHTGPHAAHASAIKGMQDRGEAEEGRDWHVYKPT